MADDLPCCETEFWMYIVIIIGLVIFAGLMAGLTLGLMSLGLVDLEVLMKSGRAKDRLHAAKIYPVVKNQHLLLCTLLIGNSLAMEAVCSRHGLKVGARMAPLVHVLLLLFYPISYPISKVLDWMLGKGHGVLLRRAELKAFMNLHGNEAGKGGDLTHDETTIITGALEMTEKTAKDAMTSIDKAFSIDLDGTLNLETRNAIMAKGHSRVPVYSGEKSNIVGLILVKNLLVVDPKDSIPLKKMVMRKIPRVSEHMPLYGILKEFRKGHSHIAAVYAEPDKSSVSSWSVSKPHSIESNNDRDEDAETAGSGAVSVLRRHRGCSHCILDVESSPVPEPPPGQVVVGVITMEDVIEELLQEEILDETDEYVNIHNTIRINII